MQLQPYAVSRWHTFGHSGWEADFPLLALGHFTFSPKMVRVMLFHLFTRSLSAHHVFRLWRICSSISTIKNTVCKITGILKLHLALSANRNGTSPFCTGSTTDCFKSPVFYHSIYTQMCLTYLFLSPLPAPPLPCFPSLSRVVLPVSVEEVSVITSIPSLILLSLSVQSS